MSQGSRGKLFIISGPSGAGKGTILSKILSAMPELWFSISATTRKPRVGEVDGLDYLFINELTFKELIATDGFLEWALVFDKYYGTPRSPIEDCISLGRQAILDIDSYGAFQVMEKMPQAISIFIEPPSLAELEMRLRGRGSESEEEIAKRLSCANAEISTKSRYNYSIVNDDLDKAVAQVLEIIAEQTKKGE